MNLKQLVLIVALTIIAIVGIWQASKELPIINADYVWIPSCTGNGGHYGLREYWRGPGVAEPWDVAPDGWYHVNAGDATENGYTIFPFCPSSGTRLHGTWKTDIYLPENFDGDVRVQNQTIVEMRP